MSLQFDPSFLTNGGSGNVLPYTTLNNYPNTPSSVAFYVDASNGIGCRLQLWNVGGSSVSATNGLYYQVFSTSDNVWYDTFEYYPPIQIATVANTIERQSFLLSVGKYKVVLTNLDGSNSINTMATTGNIV